MMAHLYINEFCTKNSLIPDEVGDFDDWIELYNAGDDTVNLSGLYMTNSLLEPLGYKIPPARESGTELPPGEYKIVWADGQPEEGTFHLDFNLEKSGGEIAIHQLLGGNPVILDWVKYTQQYTNYSYGRYGDGTSRWFVLSGMTPGMANLYTRLQELPRDGNIEIYPNPVSDFFEIRLFEPDANDIEVLIVDQIGREVLHQSVEGHGGQITVSPLPHGVYMVCISGSGGCVVGKVVKE